MKDDISKNVEELQNTIKTANLNYEIWWIYKNKETRELYLDAVKTYPLFFQISFHAHFVAMIVSIYRLYKNNGVASSFLTEWPEKENAKKNSGSF